MSRASSIATVASLAALMLAAPAQAQEGGGVAAWRVECTGDGKTLDCRAIQQLFHRESRQLLLMVLARRGPDAKSANLTIQLPLGLNLTEPVQIKVDSGQPEKQPIQTCTNTGCFVSMTASAQLLSAMRSGRELRITIMDGNKKPIEMGLPLLGFGLAFDKARG